MMLKRVSTQTSNVTIIITNDEAKYEQLLQHFCVRCQIFTKIVHTTLVQTD